MCRISTNHVDKRRKAAKRLALVQRLQCGPMLFTCDIINLSAMTIAVLLGLIACFDSIRREIPLSLTKARVLLLLACTNYEVRIVLNAYPEIAEIQTVLLCLTSAFIWPSILYFLENYGNAWYKITCADEMASKLRSSSYTLKIFLHMFPYARIFIISYSIILTIICAIEASHAVVIAFEIAYMLGWLCVGFPGGLMILRLALYLRAHRIERVRIRKREYQREVRFFVA